MTPMEDRFWPKVSKRGPDDCWIWTASKDRFGYGWFQAASRKAKKAHRVVLELSGIEIPPDKIVCHKCNIPACVNPAHLYLGTPLANARDKLAVGNWVQPHPGFGEEHHGAKLTWGKVDEIRREHADGATLRGLGSKHNVSYSTIEALVKHRTWRVRPCPI